MLLTKPQIEDAMKARAPKLLFRLRAKGELESYLTEKVIEAQESLHAIRANLLEKNRTLSKDLSYLERVSEMKMLDETARTMAIESVLEFEDEQAPTTPLPTMT